MFTKLFAAPAAVKGILAVAVIGISPAAALARHHDYHVDLDFRGGRPHVEIVDVPPPQPVYEDREVRVWVDPVYRTISDRQWVAPEYRTIVDRVFVPAAYEVRDVERWAYGRRYIERARVLVQPAHYEDVQRQQLACEGHWESADRQELVTPGHWEERVERVAVAYPQ